MKQDIDLDWEEVFNFIAKKHNMKGSFIIDDAFLLVLGEAAEFYGVEKTTFIQAFGNKFLRKKEKH